ncbi:MAG: hypothetical protein IPP90_10820 [Gemmatimonadaceae bacterium]|nr:hypothetical protein [Gemmatimonadaceae bacterium]
MHVTRVVRVVVGRCAFVLGALACIPPQPMLAQGDTEVLSNATVVQMVAGKLSKDLIVGKINSARPGFDLSSDGLIGLVGFKVDQNIIKLMLQVGDNARRSGSAPSTLTGLDEVLTNEIVVRMLGGKVPKQLVLAKIQMSRSTFDVSASGLVSLNTSKVPEDVIKAMLLPPPPPVSPAPIPVREPVPAPVVAPKPEAKPTTAAPKAKTAAPTKAPATKTAPPPAKKPPGA